MTKKLWLYFFSLSIFLLSSLIYIQRHSYKYSLPNVGYAKYFKRNKGELRKSFNAKMVSALPEWMESQLKRDLDLTSVSLDALRKTHETIKTQGIFCINRYRIVQNKLYKFFDPEINQIQNGWEGCHQETFTRFENALLTLLSLTQVPDVDFIVHHGDLLSEPFHKTDSIELQAPIFAWSKTKTVPYSILIPDWRSLSAWWHDNIRSVKEGKNFKEAIVHWEDKLDVAFWRGGLTNTTSRIKIADLSLENPNMLNAGITDLTDGDPKKRGFATIEEHLKYKYLPVVDGTSCPTPALQWRLLSNSLTLKQDSDDIQWFYQALKPFVHYVPFKHDLSDLMEKISWAQENESLCKNMVENANQFASQYLMFDDIYVYLYHALNRYSVLQDKTIQNNFHETKFSSDWLPIQKR